MSAARKKAPAAKSKPPEFEQIIAGTATINVPPAVPIAGQAYTNVVADRIMVGNRACMGACDWEEFQLQFLRRYATIESWHTTVLEEVCHAVCEHLKIPLEHDDQVRLVEGMSPALLRWIMAQ